MAKPLALTSGEPAGIGPDITIKAWLRRHELKLPPFYLLGDRDALQRRAKALGLKVEIADIRAEDARVRHSRDALPVVATGHAATALPGQPDHTSAGAAIASIRQAVERRHRRTGRRCRHQSDRQERAVSRRLSGIPAIPSFSPNSRRAAASRRNP